MEAETMEVRHQSSLPSRLLPSLLPTLLISIGYVDPGKWVTAVDGGARFGSDLVVVMLLFNLAAILCQYLSARIGIVTGRDLAQICSDEYDKYTCIFLGVQAELSVIALDLTMVLGLGHGLNLLFGVDLSTGVFLAAFGAFLFPVFATLLDYWKTNMLCMCMAGFVLLSFAFGVLVSQPEISISANGVLTKLNGESAFALMSLLGANIMPHNFYLHSSIVQHYQGALNLTKSALSHEHFISILCLFSGIYLVNYVLMNSAANVFYSSGFALLTFQDALSLMEQAFRSAVMPAAFFLVMFLANQITTSTWNLGGQGVLHGFLRIDIPDWLHSATIRIIAMVPALYCVWTSGAEGVYQLFILTQIMVALLLPSSVIPLFRIASSRPIMGVYKIPPFLEFAVLVTFMGMLGLKVIFVIEMIFGNSEWVGNLRWNTGIGISFSFVVLLITACSSFSLMLWLLATPLKSASARVDAFGQGWEAERFVPEESQLEEEYDLIEATNSRVEPVQRPEMFQRQEPVQRPEMFQRQEPVQRPEMFQRQEPVQRPEMFQRQEPVQRPEMFQRQEPVQRPEMFQGQEPVQRPEMFQRQEILSATNNSVESHSDESDTNFDFHLPESIMESDQEMSLATVPENSSNITYSSPSVGNSEEVISMVGKAKNIGNKVEHDDLPMTKAVKTESVGPVGKTENEDDEGDTWETEEPSKPAHESAPSVSADGPPSFRSLSGKSDEGGNGTGSLSKLAGLGRAARRQLTVVLGEFWEQLYDFHGQLTQDAKSKKLDVLFGIESKSAPASLKVDATPKEFGGYFPSAGRGSESMMSSTHYDSSKQPRVQSGIDSSYGLQTGSSLWSSPMQLLDAYGQNSSRNVDAVERRYSSMRSIPSYDAVERQYSSLRALPTSDAGERQYSSLRTLPTSDAGERQYSSLRTLPTSDAGERRYSSMHSVPSADAGERRYASLHAAPSSESWDNQPATVHGYQIASYLNRIAKDRNPNCLDGQLESTLLKSASLGPYRGSLGLAVGSKVQNGISSAHLSGYQNLAVSRNSPLQTERAYYDVRSPVPTDTSVTSVNTKKYHSLPDISVLSVPQRAQGTPPGYCSRPSYDTSMYSSSGPRAGVPLGFNELSPSKGGYRDTSPLQYSAAGSEAGSLWSRQPYEQFGVADKNRTSGSEGLGNVPNLVPQEAILALESEAKLLKSFRHCIFKLLKLEGSEWLFRQSDGADEELIDRVAAREKFLFEAETRELNLLGRMGGSQYLSSDRGYGKNDEANLVNLLVSSIPTCGDGCIWKADLVVSFGVWCIHRILDLSLMESRPELWGKYTYVLNRLQGIIELAFSKPRTPMSPCFCLQIPAAQQRSSPPVTNGMLPPPSKPGRGKCTTGPMLLDLIKDVEMAISSRKGRTGTAAGDVAFPKGKENLASVLKRYKRRLSSSNKPNEGPGSRKALTSSSAYGS